MYSELTNDEITALVKRRKRDKPAYINFRNAMAREIRSLRSCTDAIERLEIEARIKGMRAHLREIVQ